MNGLECRVTKMCQKKSWKRMVLKLERVGQGINIL